MPALLALFVSNLPMLLKAGQSVYQYIIDVRAAAKQSGEWTADAEAQFLKELDAAAIAPESLPDPTQ